MRNALFFGMSLCLLSSCINPNEEIVVSTIHRADLGARWPLEVDSATIAYAPIEDSTNYYYLIVAGKRYALNQAARGRANRDRNPAYRDLSEILSSETDRPDTVEGIRLILAEAKERVMLAQKK